MGGWMKTYGNLQAILRALASLWLAIAASALVIAPANALNLEQA